MAEYPSFRYLTAWKWGVLLILSGIPFWLKGQIQLNAFEHLSVETGLSSGKTNNYVFRDSRDFVWISSNAGLNRYDGHRIITYHQDNEDQHSLIREVASQSNIFEDLNGKLWFSGGSAVTSYDPVLDNFSNYRLRSNSGEEIVQRYKWAYLNQRRDTLLFSAQSELYYLETARPEEQLLVDSIRMGYKDVMIEVAPGIYRLLQFRPGGHRVRLKDIRLAGGVVAEQSIESKDKIYDLLLIPDSDSLWVATAKGLKLYDLGTEHWVTQSLGPEVQTLPVVELEIYGEKLIIGTENQGVFLKNTKRPAMVERLYEEEGGEIRPFEQAISRLYLDGKDNLFISTLDNGVFHTNLRSAKMRTVYDQVDQQPVVDVAFLGPDTLLVLYQSKLEVITQNETWVHALPFIGQEIDQLTFIEVDRKGAIYIGTFNKLHRAASIVNPEWRIVEALPTSLPAIGPGYNDLLHLPGNHLLLGINVGKACVVDSEFREAKWLKENIFRPRKFAFDGQEMLLVATYADTLHLLRYDAKTRSAQTVQEYLELPSVNDLYFDKNANLFWIATMNGLYKLEFSQGRAKLEPDHIIGQQAVFSIAGEHVEGMYLGAAEGLLHYNPDFREISLFRAADGIQGVEYSPHALAISERGAILAGGYNGANILSEQDLVSGLQAPIIRLVSVYIRDQKVDDSDIQELGHDENDLRFEFMEGDYADPQGVVYRYRLFTNDGQERVQERRAASVTFANLAPDIYQLEVSAINSDGRACRQPLILPFTILPPWYQTWWAYTLYALAIAVLAFTFFWIRLQGIRRAEKEQLRAARAEALAAETETSVLRLQMNPHFIFNSLNAVNAYIIKGDKLKAHEYLVQFADLIREILNRSARPLTRMDLAIELLRDYLEAERMRVGEKLTYAFEVDEDIDTFTTYLPTMILQPFVENAIWHGISGLPQGGRVTLRFGLEGTDQLCIQVEDNGRGRKATSRSGKRHKSMAMDITRRRLEILNQTSTASASHTSVPAAPPVQAHYEIVDLHHPDGTAAGTRAVLYLPAEYPKEDARNSD